jgi:hypothetical protein
MGRQTRTIQKLVKQILPHSLLNNIPPLCIHPKKKKKKKKDKKNRKINEQEKKTHQKENKKNKK